MSILGELKRRKIFQVIAVYAVVAWLVVQIITAIEGPLNLPDWTDTLVIVLLGLGFPVMLVISWAFNVTPGGLVRDDGDEATNSGSGRTIEFVLIGLVGIAVVWLLYRTEFSEAPLPPEPQVVEEFATPDVLPNSIAVLPFANMSPDPDNAHFASGIHDTILNELAKAGGMNVISRNAVMRYADIQTSMSQIAEDLRVQTIMEGSVQYAEGRVLITAQLIDPRTNVHLWSENYDRPFSDIFELQIDIASKIAVAMNAELTQQEQAEIRARMTESPVAQARYWAAMELIEWDFSPGDSTPEVHRMLDEAIEADVQFALAYATKANIYAYNRHELELAETNANLALEIDPNLGSAYGAMASIYNRTMQDEESYAAYEIALELSPNDIDILDNYSRSISLTGDSQKILDLAQKVMELDPARLRFLALTYWNVGDDDKALTTIREAAIESPDSHLTLSVAAVYERLVGNPNKVDGYIRRAISLEQSDRWSLNYLAQSIHRYGVTGASDDAARLFAVFEQRANERPSDEIDPGLRVRACLGIRNYDCVRRNIDMVIEWRRGGFRSVNSASVARNTYRESVLESPEFVELRKQLGFTVPGL